MRAINLLPQQVAGEASPGLGGKLALIGSGAVPVIAIVLVFIGYTSVHSAVTGKQAQLAAINAQIAAATAPATPVTATPALNTAGLVAERSARLAALQSVLTDEVPWDTTLDDIARVLPPNVWLTSLTAISPTPADAIAPVVAPTTTTTATTTTAGTPAPAPTPVAAPAPGFTIQGSTYTQQDVATLLGRLELVPSLSNIALVSTTQALVGDKEVDQFDVTATLQLPSVLAQS